MDLSLLFQLQKKLDQKIEQKQQLNHPELTKSDVLTQKTLALMIEAGEFVNEVQSFKYWKINKNVNLRNVTEEFADLLHFLINLAYAYDVNPFIKPRQISDDINQQFQQLFIGIGKIMQMANNADIQSLKTQITKVFEIALGSFVMLGFTYGQMIQAYFYKNQKNFKRLYSNY
ncbi:dUTP diphosphatase [Mycoplasma sp. 394]|uniref:dUTP diphosphatase n=1 Tax=Mycoplasma sp. 6243 TaxID=3440865 RepID=UPI003EBAB769